MLDTIALFFAVPVLIGLWIQMACRAYFVWKKHGMARGVYVMVGQLQDDVVDTPRTPQEHIDSVLSNLGPKERFEDEIFERQPSLVEAV